MKKCYACHAIQWQHEMIVKKNNVFSSEQVGASKPTLNIQLLRYSCSYIKQQIYSRTY